MITEEMKCDACGKDFEMANSHDLHDRKNYFGIKQFREDKPGVSEIENLTGVSLSKCKGLTYHLCSYKCLMRKYAQLILPELKKERQEAKKEEKKDA